MTSDNDWSKPDSVFQQRVSPALVVSTSELSRKFPGEWARFAEIYEPRSPIKLVSSATGRLEDVQARHGKFRVSAKVDCDGGPRVRWNRNENVNWATKLPFDERRGKGEVSAVQFGRIQLSDSTVPGFFCFFFPLPFTKLPFSVAIDAQTCILVNDTHRVSHFNLEMQSSSKRYLFVRYLLTFETCKDQQIRNRIWGHLNKVRCKRFTVNNPLWGRVGNHGFSDKLSLLLSSQNRKKYKSRCFSNTRIVPFRGQLHLQLD